MDRNSTTSSPPVDRSASDGNTPSRRPIPHSSALPLLATMVSTLLLALVLIVATASSSTVGSGATSLLLS